MKTKYLSLAIIFIAAIACNKNESFTVVQSSSAEDASINSPSLVAWYTFNGDVLDHSQYGNNVYANGAVPAKGQGGVPNTAYYFNGGTWMQVHDSKSLNPRREITIAALIQPQGFYNGTCHANRILQKGINDQDYGTYFLGFDDAYYYNFAGCDQPVKQDRENFYGSFGDNQTYSVGARDTTTYVQTGKWYAIVFTVDSNKVSKLYINKKLVAMGFNAIADFSGNTRDLFIGRMYDSQYPYFFTGNIDEIRIYHRTYNIETIDKLSDDLGEIIDAIMINRLNLAIQNSNQRFEYTATYITLIPNTEAV